MVNKSDIIEKVNEICGMLKGALLHRLDILRNITPSFLLETNPNKFKNESPSYVYSIINFVFYVQKCVLL
jgi:hypothetical protein